MSESRVTFTPPGSGSSIIAPSGSAAPGVAVEQSGTTIVSKATKLNFTAGATIADAGDGTATINIYGGDGSTEPLFSLGPEITQYDPGTDMPGGIINPLEYPTALGLFTVIELRGADSQATRITGIDASAVTSDKSVVLFINTSPTGIDCGQVVFYHLNSGTASENQIWCPGNVDYTLANGGGIFCRYGNDNKWHILDNGATARYGVFESIRLYPCALMPQITGTLTDPTNNWNPTAESSYGDDPPTGGVGVGLAGGDCTAEEYTLQRITGVATACLTGYAPNAGNNDDLPTLGGVRLFYNEGLYPITFRHLNGASTEGRQFECPEGVDYVLKPGEGVWGCSMFSDPNPDSNMRLFGPNRQARVQIITASIPGEQIDNWNPVDATSGVDFTQADWIVANPSVDTVINSINPGINGQRITLSADGGGMVLNHNESGGSGGITTGVPIYCPGGESFTLVAYASTDLQFFGSVWWVIESRVGGA